MITSPLARPGTLPRMTLMAWALLALCAGDGAPQAACSHYAAPTGTGALCTAAQPCAVASFWPLASPGKTLCLKSGTYKGSASMILPPAGLKGTQAAPITIRAEHDGQALLDANHGGFAVWLGSHNGNSNDWFVVEGINATNGLEATWREAGAHNLFKRVIGYHGTAGQADSNIFRITGAGSMVEDCAGWGHNTRKIFDGAQAGNVQGTGFRRCWGEWNDHPGGTSQPTNTLQLGYNTTNQLFENMVMTMDATGDQREGEGVLSFMENQYGEANAIEGTRVLGSIVYLRPGATPAGYELVHGGGISGVTFRDLAMVVMPGFPTLKPAWFIGGSGNCGRPTPCVNNTCTNCLAVHDGAPIQNDSSSGFTLPGLRQGKGLQAATGGTSAFELLPGLCKRYEGGVLTDKPLWPLPMTERIKAARVASGFAAVDVTAEVEALLGPIPSQCMGGGTEPPMPPDPPVRPSGTPLSCVGVQSESGGVAVACVPQAQKGTR